jgi:hypothetical protein
MTKKYDYKVFPETTRARVGLGLAFAGGLFLAVGYLVLFLIPSPLGFANWLDEIDVTYVNRTDETVAVYVNNDLDVTVPPGEEVTVEYRKIEWWWNADFEVRDLQGRLISANRYDDDDLKRLDYRVVIDD